MLYKTTFPRCVPALGKVGALGFAFFQFAPRLSPTPAVPFCAQLPVACNYSSSKGSEREGARKKAKDDKNSAENKQNKTKQNKTKGYFHSELFAAVLQRPAGRRSWGCFLAFLLFKPLSEQN